jgi:MerR family transcriptional regulator, thiopeptide resistance regulator
MQTVGEVSKLAGVTVRTLHHYDEIALLSPSGRSEAGYRLYDYWDLVRLQEILVWRQLGFSLPEVQRLLDDPAHDRRAALMRQRELVQHERERLGASARALDRALAADAQDTPLKEAEMFEDFDPAAYEDEARQRWGDTDAYRESARRTAAYGDREWAEIGAEAEAIVGEFAALMSVGEPSAGENARAVAERHRDHLARWFYPASTDMHRNLAGLYVADPRFAAGYDKVADGLARYVHDAVVANADAQDAVSR